MVINRSTRTMHLNNISLEFCDDHLFNLSSDPGFRRYRRKSNLLKGVPEDVMLMTKKSPTTSENLGKGRQNGEGREEGSSLFWVDHGQGLG